MIFFIFLIFENFLYAFNEHLTAVHYSIVTPGIDEEIRAGIFEPLLNSVIRPYSIRLILITF